MTAYAAIPDWLAAFRADADACLDRMLRQADSISPMQRGLASDVVLTALSEGEAADRDAADAALASWLAARLAEGDAIIDSVGRGAYSAWVRDGLLLAGWLRGPVTGRLLRERHRDLMDWAASLSEEGDPADLRLTYLSALAACQDGRHFRRLWLDLCDQAGAGRLSQTYFDIGLHGLRHMRPGQPPAEADLAEGLAAWAAHLKDSPADRARFDRAWTVLRQAHPRNLRDWQKAVGRLLDRFALRPFAAWLSEGLELTPTRPETPYLAQTKRVLEAVNAAPGEAAAEAGVARFFRYHLSYAVATGDWTVYPVALHVVGKRLLKRGWPRLAGRLARLIVDRVPRHGQSWVLLAESLTKSGLTDAAESVLWDACRLLPDDVYCRVSLATLIERQGRGAEAEALFRQALESFGDNVACCTGLAHVVAEAGAEGLAEAESLYRKALAREPDNGHALLGLGLVLVQRNRLPEVPPIIDELEAAGDSRAVTLRYRYLEALGKIPPKAPDEKATQEPVAAGPEWATEIALGEALRAKFLFSPALDDRKLRFVDDTVRTDLRAKAAELLADAVRRAPHHPVVALIARRRAGGSAAAVDEARLMFGRDFGLRLELASTSGRTDAFDWLDEDFPDSGRRAVTALARLQADPDHEDALRTMRSWLSVAPPADPPILAFAHAELRRRLKEWAFRGEDEFLEGWQMVNPEDVGHLLDIVQLGLALSALPLLADEPMLEFEDAAAA